MIWWFVLYMLPGLALAEFTHWSRTKHNGDFVGPLAYLWIALGYPIVLLCLMFGWRKK